MPNFELIKQPTYPLHTFDSDDPIELNTLIKLMGEDDNIMLCVRSAEGHPNRGGYFFCISKNTKNTFKLYTIEGVYVDTFSEEQIIRLINHASGRKFDSEMLDFCQNKINFRTD